MQTGKNGFQAARELFVPTGQHLFHGFALQVFLGAAQIAGNDRKFFKGGKAIDVSFPAIRQWPDHDVLLIIAEQFGRHGFHFAGEEHVQEKRFDDVFAMVAQGNFADVVFSGKTVQGAAPQSGTQAAGGFTFRNNAFDDTVGIVLDDMKRYADGLQVFG